MEMLIKRALDSNVWCVVGATPNTNRFGYKIYKKLKTDGYCVYGINPNHAALEEDQLYAEVDALPEVPQCVNMVVSPDKGIGYLEAFYKKGVKLLWFQPGAYNNEIIEKAKEIGFDCIFGRCVLVELNAR